MVTIREHTILWGSIDDNDHVPGRDLDLVPGTLILVLGNVQHKDYWIVFCHLGFGYVLCRRWRSDDLKEA